MCAAASAVPPWRSPTGPGLPGGVSVYSPRPVPSPRCPTHGGSPTGPPSHPESQQMAPCARRWRRPEPGTGGVGSRGGTGRDRGRAVLGSAGICWFMRGWADPCWAVLVHSGLYWAVLC